MIDAVSLFLLAVTPPAGLLAYATVSETGTTGNDLEKVAIGLLLAALTALGLYVRNQMGQSGTREAAALAAKDAALEAKVTLWADVAEVARQDAAYWRERFDRVQETLDATNRLQIEQGIAASRDNSRALDAVLGVLQGIDRDRSIARQRGGLDD